MVDYTSEIIKYTTCDISDALTQLGLKNFFIPDLDVFSKNPYCTDSKGRFTKFFGPAYTVKVVHSEDKTQPKFDSQSHWLDGVSKGQVVMIATPEGTINAVFGGLMGARASFLGAGGVVVGGRIRDIGELNSQGLNVLAAGKSIMGAGGHTRVSEINVPIEFSAGKSKVTVRPGDYIMADQDGVVVLPFEHLEDVITKCSALVSIDEKCMNAIVNGSSIYSAFKTFR